MFLRNWIILHIFTSLWILIFNKLWKHWFKFCNVHGHTLLYHYRECNVCHQSSSKILCLSHNFQVGGFYFGFLRFRNLVNLLNLLLSKVSRSLDFMYIRTIVSSTKIKRERIVKKLSAVKSRSKLRGNKSVCCCYRRTRVLSRNNPALHWHS